MKATEEALAILRELSEEDPRYNSDLADAYLCLGADYGIMKSYSQAVDYIQSAITILTKLVKDDPSLSTTLIDSLHLLGTLLSTKLDEEERQRMSGRQIQQG